MTENEAIEKIKDLYDRGYPTLRTAKEIAIKALEEIQHYRAIGTAEECREAVEKQKPEKPEIYTDTISHGGHFQSHTVRKGETQLKEKVIIYKNPNGDTRTAPKGITYEQFQAANDSHRDDVNKVVSVLSLMLSENGLKHDWTKKSEEKMFYSDFIEAMAGGIDFVSGEWYQFHVNTERHHLLSRCPDDVNLLDVIEMIVDCVCAGKTRSGEVRDLEISTDILEKALNNTVKLVDDMTVVK